MKTTRNHLILTSLLILSFALSYNVLFAKKTVFKTRLHSANIERTTSKYNNSHFMYVNGLFKERGLSENIFILAYGGFEKLGKAGMLSSDSIITIIDFSKPSNEKRLYVIDLKSGEILYHSVVSHGRNTGEKFARIFSNKPESHMSSLGFYITRKTYMGGNGYSLQLQGIEKGYNDNAMARSVVVHGADYAEESFIAKQGYLGRSYGCPALPRGISKQVIEKIKDGNLLFAYYPDNNYLKNSSLLN